MIVREFADGKNAYSWLDFCGVVAADSEAAFGIREEEIMVVKKQLKVSEKLIDALKKNISKNLESFV